MTEVDRIAAVRAMWPHRVPVDAAVRSTRGQFNDVLIVDDAFVVRFPRTAAAARSLVAETGLLRALHGLLPCAIPVLEDARVVGGAADTGVMGYPLIPGVGMTRELVAGLGPPAVAAAAAQVGAFVRALHAVPRAHVPPGVPAGDDRAAWAGLYDDFRRELFGLMRPDARHAVTADFEAFFATCDDASWTPVLRHGDLGGENIRYDAETNRITGFIDFGAAALGDPAVDLAALSWYGEVFLAGVFAVYPDLARPAARARAAFYRGTHALQQALWAGRAGDAAEFADGMAAYV